MQTHYSLRINQNVTTELPEVFTELSELCSAEHQAQVLPGVYRSVGVPPTRIAHSVCLIELSLPVQQNWPLQFVRQGVLASHVGRVKGHNHDRHVFRLEEICFLPQLRQMVPARQSSKVTMKNEQKPPTAKITFAQELARCCGQFEVRCWLTEHKT